MSFDGKTVVLFSLPGALTPEYRRSERTRIGPRFFRFKALGVDTVACLSVNDPDVMSAFSKKLDAEGKILFLADGDVSLTKSLGLEPDTGAFGGSRATRGVDLVANGECTKVNLGKDGAFGGTSSMTRS